MRSLLVLSLLATVGSLSGCAQTWGLGERPPAPPESVDARPPSDAEIVRLEGLADRLEAALAEVEAVLARGEGSWADGDTEVVRESLQGQQERLERRLVLSVALANLRAAIASRQEALAEARSDDPVPSTEPIPADVDEVVRQAEEQVRAARDRRDARSDDDGLPTTSKAEVALDRLTTGERDRKKDKRKAAVVVEQPSSRVELEKALVPHYDALSSCVPKSAGVSRVIVRGRLSADGQLRELRVVEGVSIPAIVGCLTDRLESITVPMPAGASARVVTFPLHFAGP
jgi:hypothetical protein